jgi:hypothetical protein
LNEEIQQNKTSEPVKAPPGPVNELAEAGLILIVIGALLSYLTLITNGGTEVLGLAYLLGFTFLWAIVLGSLFFVVLQHLVGAVWSVVLRRVGEMLASPAWLVALLFIPVILFNRTNTFPLFPWAVTGEGETLHLSPAKEMYLDFGFFVLRAIGIFVLWILFARYFVRGSLRQDRGGPADGRTVTMRKVAGPFMPIFAVILTVAGFDWLMSLEPDWYSSIFPVYLFSGVVLSSLAAITLVAIWLRRIGGLGNRVVTNEHLFSLGGLIFAFSCFWAYIAFSQFMLIWYANLPEETFYFIRRTEPGWVGLSVTLFLVRFVLPFFLLLSHGAKRKPGRLVIVSVLVLIGQFIDLYWLIMPGTQKSSAGPGWQEIGPSILMIGILLIYISKFIRKKSTLPVGDPLFEQSKKFYLEH